VTRVLGLLLHNWPLKVAAIGLAMLLYGGLVLSQSSRTLPGPIPVDPVGLTEETYLLTPLEPVRSVSYFAPSGISPSQSTFRATVDLTSVEPGSGPVSVPILMESIDDRVSVLSIEPDVMTVELDDITTVDVPVEVDYGTAPPTLEVGATIIDPNTVKVTGPASIVRNVVKALATVVVQPSGLSIDQDVPVTAVDAEGNPVTPVRVEPAIVHIDIPVFSDRKSKTVPVTPIVTGTPAGGFEIASLTVSPPTVTVEGNADQLANLVKIDTEPIPVTGLSSEETRDVPLSLPSGVTALDTDTVQVVIELRPVTATRTFEVGLRLLGEDPDLRYTPATDRVRITVGGSIADLDRLEGSTLVADLDVTDLTTGSASVPVTADLPAGVTLVIADPVDVEVTVSARPSPPASPAVVLPSASPAG